MLLISFGFCRSSSSNHYVKLTNCYKHTISSLYWMDDIKGILTDFKERALLKFSKFELTLVQEGWCDPVILKLDYFENIWSDIHSNFDHFSIFEGVLTLWRHSDVIHKWLVLILVSMERRCPYLYTCSKFRVIWPSVLIIRRGVATTPFGKYV